MSKLRHQSPPVYNEPGRLPTGNRFVIIGILVAVTLAFIVGRWSVPTYETDVSILQNRLFKLEEQKNGEISTLKAKHNSSASNFGAQISALIQERNAALRDNGRLTVSCNNDRALLSNKVKLLRDRITRECSQ